MRIIPDGWSDETAHPGIICDKFYSPSLKASIHGSYGPSDGPRSIARPNFSILNETGDIKWNLYINPGEFSSILDAAGYCDKIVEKLTIPELVSLSSYTLLSLQGVGNDDERQAKDRRYHGDVRVVEFWN